MNLLVEYNNESETIYSSPDFFNSAHVGLIDHMNALQKITENEDNPKLLFLLTIYLTQKKRN